MPGPADTAAQSAKARRHRGGAPREQLEAPLRLRRDIGPMPGVATNLVELTYIAAAQGRHEKALAL